MVKVRIGEERVVVSKREIDFDFKRKNEEEVMRRLMMKIILIVFVGVGFLSVGGCGMFD